MAERGNRGVPLWECPKHGAHWTPEELERHGATGCPLGAAPEPDTYDELYGPSRLLVRVSKLEAALRPFADIAIDGELGDALIGAGLDGAVMAARAVLEPDDDQHDCERDGCEGI